MHSENRINLFRLKGWAELGTASTEKYPTWGTGEAISHAKTFQNIDSGAASLLGKYSNCVAQLAAMESVEKKETRCC